LDATGNLYVADGGNNLIREVTTAGMVSTVTGNGTQGSGNGATSSASFFEPTGTAVDPAANIYVTDTGNKVCPR
jgi:serine/threonine protein kinase, bacterial